MRTACDTSGRFPIIPTILTRLALARAVFFGSAVRRNKISKEVSVRRMGMNRFRRVARLATTASLCVMLGGAASARAGQPGQDAAKQPYTMPEYNAYQACAQEKSPSAQVKCL